MGANEAAPAGKAKAGMVVVVYGGPSLVDQQLDLQTVGANGETRILGAWAGDETGGAVASADVNGDGYDDIIIGAPQGEIDPASGNTDRGIVHIVYGAASYSSHTLDLSRTPGSYGETRIHGAENAQHIGTGLATGDVNGDGYPDIVIAPNTWTGDNDGYVIYGRADLSATTTIDLSDAPHSHGETIFTGEDMQGRRLRRCQRRRLCRRGDRMPLREQQPRYHLRLLRLGLDAGHNAQPGRVGGSERRDAHLWRWRRRPTGH